MVEIRLEDYLDLYQHCQFVLTFLHWCHNLGFDCPQIHHQCATPSFYLIAQTPLIAFFLFHFLALFQSFLNLSPFLDLAFYQRDCGNLACSDS